MKKVAIANDGYPWYCGGNGDTEFSHYEYQFETGELQYGEIDDTIKIEITKTDDRIEILAEIPSCGKMAEACTYRKGVAIINNYGVIKAWISPKALDLYSRDLFIREVECEFFGGARFDSLESAAEWVKLALRTWKGA